MKIISRYITAISGSFFLFLMVFTLATEVKGQNNESFSYDYKKINNHPRLLLKKGEEEKIKLAIKKNPEYQKVNSYIIKIADSLLLEKPLFFKKEGKRLLAVSRKALTRLYYWSYVYRLTNNVKYLKRVELELEAISDFESWNPSHFLDVGEMCMAVAIAYDWLYDDLNKNIKKKVRKAIVEKAFVPSYNKNDAWFLERHNNWNSVCNAGLVYGALAIFEDEKERSTAIIERALKTSVLPLEAYGPDGNYPEGPGYWVYGTSFQVMLFAALESALGSDKGLSKAPGFMESANYMLFAAGPSGKYFNYYDGGERISAASVMFWFADKMNDPSLVYEEITALNKGIYTKFDNSDVIRFLPNTLVFGKDLILSDIKIPTKNIFTGHGITPVSIIRTDWGDGKGKYLGIKGGKASDPHAHMDQGTFVYDVDNLRWAMDFGLQSYITLESKGVDIWNMEQNSQRWDVFRYNNLNHNTISINNKRHNINGYAKIIESFNENGEIGAKVDITPALNFNNELKSAIRTAKIVDNDYLKIEDEVEVNQEKVNLRWNMVTPAKAQIINDTTILLTQNNKTMNVIFEANIPIKLVIRLSENPKEYKNEFGSSNYEEYNQENRGSVMFGFDVEIPANQKGKFSVFMKEN